MGYTVEKMLPLIRQVTYVFFFSFMPVTFEIVYTCVPIGNANAYEVLSDNYK